jgi:hypothetical protein
LSYIEKEGDLVHLGDGSGYRIIGVGDIKFKMCNGQKILLKGVKHVPGLRMKLISLGSCMKNDGCIRQRLIRRP